MNSNSPPENPEITDAVQGKEEGPKAEAEADRQGSLLGQSRRRILRQQLQALRARQLANRLRLRRRP